MSAASVGCRETLASTERGFPTPPQPAACQLPHGAWASGHFQLCECVQRGSVASRQPCKESPRWGLFKAEAHRDLERHRNNERDPGELV